MTDINNRHMESLLNEVRKEVVDPGKGLPEELFLFISELTPLINVDLLIRDNKGRILLAWRNDPWWESGWHVPGGIIRLNETIDERIERTAKLELGTTVFHGSEPVEVCQIINKVFSTRSHHITLVYECRVPEDYIIDNGSLMEHDTGFLAWHDHYPDQMLRCHEFYRKYFKDN